MASSGMIFLMGIAMFFNIAVIKFKLENDRVADAIFDLSILILLSWWLSDTISGMAMGTVASATFSIYLLFSPPKIDWDNL